MAGDTVPFGKYRGRPVEDMLADADYMAWLEAQPWFRERYAHFRRDGDKDRLDQTPTHNRLQALFLAPAYQNAFVKTAAAKFLAEAQRDHLLRQSREVAGLTEAAERYMELAKSVPPGDHQKVATLTARADEHLALIALVEAGTYFIKIDVSFEYAGADVRMRLHAFRASLAENKMKLSAAPELFEGAEFLIEIKPVVADDYPVVLRQMRRHKTKYLFLGEYCGEGASFEEFVGMFAASGIKVVMKHTVDQEARA